jgi:CHAT domain-containing protein/tetratricopeptide (TPR) repeat protein
MGEYEEAERVLQGALAVSLDANDKEGQGTALNLLAGLRFQMGDHPTAAALWENALTVKETLVPLDRPNVIGTLMNLASAHGLMGDLRAAERTHEQVLEQYVEYFETDEHPLVAMAMDNLGAFVRDQGRYEEAAPLLERAFVLREKLVGPESREVARSLANLGILYRYTGDLDRAEANLREALSIRIKVVGHRHPLVAKTYSNLGKLHVSKEDYPTAADHFRKAIDTWTSIRSDHPDMIPDLRDFASVERGQKEYALAESLLIRATAIYEEAWQNLRSDFQRVGFITRSPSWNLALVQLALGKEAEAWHTVERELMRKWLDVPAGSGGVRLQGNSWNEMAPTVSIPKLTKVQQSLNDKSAIIGWVEWVDDMGPAGAWAYVIRRSGPVSWIPLSQRSLEQFQLIRHRAVALQDAARGSASDELRRSGRELWISHMEPAMRALGDVTNLIIIPSGLMTGIPFELLLDDQGNYLSDRYDISYAASATVYAELALARSGNVKTKALVVGDPDLRSPARPQELTVVTDEGPVGTTARTAEWVSEPLLHGFETPGEYLGLHEHKLTSAKEQMNVVVPLLTEATVLAGSRASEAEVLAQARSGLLREYGSILLAVPALSDSLYPHRSALLLSPGVTTSAGDSTVTGQKERDGLITAEEVLSHWSLDCHLVTLSIRERGTTGGRSVDWALVLEESFLKAGARSVLASRWVVEDEAASLFLRRFYENWLGMYAEERAGRRDKAMTKSGALSEARRWLRDYEAPEGRRPYADPKYWASFVLLGDGG